MGRQKYTARFYCRKQDVKFEAGKPKEAAFFFGYFLLALLPKESISVYLFFFKRIKHFTPFLLKRKEASFEDKISWKWRRHK